jgi:DNA polymerase I-like protein with 3'-5' exonuclease and polymerase domains
MKPASPQAYALMHEGSLALSRMESVGMPVHGDRLDTAIADISNRIKDMESELRGMAEYQEQRKRYGAKTKLGSREQLADILYNVMGHQGGQVNPETGKLSLDDEALKEINTPYTKLYQRTQKLYKLRGTYLEPFKRELCNGRVHAFFNLHTVTTYRSSSDSPNLQNLPIRDPDTGPVIRGVIKPHDPNNVIVEIDYAQLEVYVAACYHRDPTMLDILKTGTDLHKDSTLNCFKLDAVEKPIRQAIKGLWTFAAFYGDAPASIAKNLWHFAQDHKMESGRPLLEHLSERGIKNLGFEKAMTSDSFMQHIHTMFSDFWNKRFPVYKQWRNDWFQEYLRNGHFHTLTGFRVWGIFKRNEIINSPVQGAAFHCLLKSIIELTKRISHRKMRSRLFCQIHDSLIAEVPREELDDYIEMANEVMTKWIRTQWPWIIVDLKTEVEVGEDSWASKKAYHKPS